MKKLNLLLITLCVITFFLSRVSSAKPVTNDQKKVYIDEQIRFADGLVQRRHYDLAIDEYKGLIEKFPDSELVAEAWIELAQAYAAKKDYINSFATFTLFFEKFPNTRILPAGRLKYAIILNKSGSEKNKQKAIRILLELKKDSKTPEIINEAAIFHLGKIYQKNQQYKKAEREFLQIAKKKATSKKDNFRAYAAFEMAEIREKQNNLTEAIALLAPLAESTSLPPEIYNSILWKLSNLLYAKKEFKKAANLFAKTAIIFPKTVTGNEARYRRLECLYRIGEYPQVITEVDKLTKPETEKIVNIAPERLYYIKALALRKLNFHQQAVRLLSSILKETDNAKIRPLVAYAYIESLLTLGKIKEAREKTNLFIMQNNLPSDTIKDTILLLLAHSRNNRDNISILNSALKTMKKGSEPAGSLLLKKAALLIEENKKPDAEKIYRKLSVNAYKKLRPYALMGLAQMLEQQQKNKEALATYQTILETFPNTLIYPDTMLRIAVLLLKDKKQWETAKIYLSDIAKRFPESPAALSAIFYTAYVSFYEKQYTLAETLLLDIVKRKGLSSELYSDINIYLAWIYLKTKQIKKAVAIINKEEILERAPAQFLFELGENTTKKDPETARKAFTKLATFDNQEYKQQALIGLANAQLALGDAVKAIGSLKKAVQVDANPLLTSSAITQLGNLLFMRGKKNEAVMAFEKCLDNPVDKRNSAIARLGLAKILAEDKERLKTANRYAMSVFILSNDKKICSEAMLLSIKISIEMGNKEEAKSTWKEFSTRFPDLAKNEQALTRIFHETEVP